MNMQAETVSWWRNGLGNLIARLFGSREPAMEALHGSVPAKTAARGFWSNFSRKTSFATEAGEFPSFEADVTSNILVPVDFSATSFRALDCAVRLARQAKCRVTLLHVVHLNLTPYGPGNPTWLKAALRREAVSKAEAIANNLRTSGIKAECKVEEGTPATLIARIAAQQHAQMIIMATPRRGPIARLFQQKTVEHVIRDAQCPVLVLQTEIKEGIL